jgi:hypothetical protein
MCPQDIATDGSPHVIELVFDDKMQVASYIPHAFVIRYP